MFYQLYIMPLFHLLFARLGKHELFSEIRVVLTHLEIIVLKTFSVSFWLTYNVLFTGQEESKRNRRSLFPLSVPLRTQLQIDPICQRHICYIQFRCFAKLRSLTFTLDELHGMKLKDLIFGENLINVLLCIWTILRIICILIFSLQLNYSLSPLLETAGRQLQLSCGYQYYFVINTSIQEHQ